MGKHVTLLLLLLSLEAGSLSQVPSSSYAYLSERGFTSVEIRKADLLWTEPHYTLFKEWTRCVDGVTASFLLSGKSGRETETAAFGLCAESEADLRALLARPVGLPTAGRLLELAKAEKAFAIQEAHAKQNPKDPTLFAKMDGWSVNRTPSGCIATKVRSGGVSTYATAMLKEGEKILVLFGLSSDNARQAARESAGARIVKKVTPIGSKTPSRRVAFYPVPAGSYFYFAHEWSPDIRALMAGSHQLQLTHESGSMAVPNGDNQFRVVPPYIFETGNIESAYETLTRCTSP